MGGEALRVIRDTVHSQGAVPVRLRVEYRVLFSTLQGNMPVNDRIHGEILDIPIDLRLEHTVVPNIYGTYPVDYRFHGSIGDVPVSGKMGYTLVYSTIAGNFPVNTDITMNMNGKEYRLDMPRKFALGRARGSGSGGSGGGGKRRLSMRYSKGVLVVDDGTGGGEGSTFEVHRPISAGIEGIIDDVHIQLHFSNTYYTNTNGGRSPINHLLTGFLQAVN